MTTPGRQLAYPETRCREDLTNVIALIHLGFLDAKDYPQISPDLEIRPPPEKEMNTKEKIVFYSLCFLIFAGLGVGIFYIASPCSFVINMGKFQCRDVRFSANLYCAPDYTESRSNYCDECGIVNNKDLNNPASWPFLVLIKFEHIWDQVVQDSQSKQSSKVKMSKDFYCTGTIIDRYTIATSPSCYRRTFVISYDNKNYLVTVGTNSYQPSYANMFTIYAGIRKGKNLTDQVIDASALDSLFENVFQVDQLRWNNPMYHFLTTNWAFSINERMTIACYHSLNGILKFPIYRSTVFIASWSLPKSLNGDNSGNVQIKFNFLRSYLLPQNTTNKLYTLDGNASLVYDKYSLNEGDALLEKDPEKNSMLSLIGLFSTDNNFEIVGLNDDTHQTDTRKNVFNGVYDVQNGDDN